MTIGGETAREFNVTSGNCSECRRLIVFGQLVPHVAGRVSEGPKILLYPPGPIIRPIAQEVTGEYRQDFREACLVLTSSPKASAALSRRLLQHVIREKAGITKRNLDEEIAAVIDQGDLSSNVAEDLDMIRTIGNFAAHPIKSTNTGEVVEVEPGEAEALLDVLEQLFDHYFVRPAKRAAMRAQINEKINEKLTAAGKQALKGSTAEQAAAAEEPEGASVSESPEPPGAPPVLS
jgi:hypothetical protein